MTNEGRKMQQKLVSVDFEYKPKTYLSNLIGGRTVNKVKMLLLL